MGGGFVVNQDEGAEDHIVADTTALPHPFAAARILLAQCDRSGLRIAALMRENEQAWRDDDAIHAGLQRNLGAMQAA